MRSIVHCLILGLIWLWEVPFFFLLWLIDEPLILFIQRKIKETGINVINVYEQKSNDKAKDKETRKNQNTAKNVPTVFVHDKLFYRRVLRHGLFGLGESYVDGQWSCLKVDEASTLFCSNGLLQFAWQLPWNRCINYLRHEFLNMQTADRAFMVGKQHYDLGNELFESMLDKNLNYTCGYWKNAKNLEEAQHHKMELIARKLYLKPGMRVLDMGCGFGNMCKFLAQNYQVSVVGVTVSIEQAKKGQERCKGLPVEIRLADYRSLNEKFDRVFAIGLMEHVGKHNYRTFYKVAHRCLKDHGIFLLHTIGVGSPDTPTSELWLSTYIFPNGRLPYHTEITEDIDGLFLIEDWHNFGADYDKTLLAWHANFVKNWPSIRHHYKDPEKFDRMWSYYLLSCAGIFRSRKFHLWHVVLSKKGVRGGYKKVT